MHHLSEEFHRDDDLFLDYFDVAGAPATAGAGSEIGGVGSL